MKTVYRAGRSADTDVAARAARGRQDASRLRWGDVAQRVERFVDYLDNRPVMRRKLRLGWVSTWNAQCGIAAHSEHLLEFFDKDAFDLTILADDQKLPGPDDDNVRRLWSKDGGGLYNDNRAHVDSATFFSNAADNDADNTGDGGGGEGAGPERGPGPGPGLGPG